jgi:hypothetical protein
MLEITRVDIKPNLPLIGKDLDVGATHNADVSAAQPDLPAGTIMHFTAVGPAQEMVKATLPLVAPATGWYGILAADSYQTFDNAATPVAINRPAMVYRRGVFIRSTVNEVNGSTFTPNTAAGLAQELILQDAGIFLEESWDENQYNW